MVLVANKPCSFGGQKFYIGDKIPASLVADARTQEKLGVLTIVNDREEEAGGQLEYTQAQADKMVEEAVSMAVNNTIMEMEQKQQELQQAAGMFKEYGEGAYDGIVQVTIMGETSGGNGQVTVIPATPEDIQQVFSIMQMNAEDGAKEIASVKSGNVLVLLHAADSRKTIKNAAKEQAGKLSPPDSLDASGGGNVSAGASTEGAGG